MFSLSKVGFSSNCDLFGDLFEILMDQDCQTSSYFDGFKSNLCFFSPLNYYILKPNC